MTPHGYSHPQIRYAHRWCVYHTLGITGHSMTTDESEIAGFLRFFPTRERLGAFIAGELYLNTPHYYRQLEKVGVGDDFDACIAYYSAAKHAQPPRIVVDGQHWDLSKSSEVLIYLDEDKYDAHLQCWLTLAKPESDEDLRSIQSDIARVKSEFGEHCAFLPSENLEPYLRVIWQEAKMPLRAEAVSYIEDRLQGSMFVKRPGYSYQREYRIALGKIAKGANDPHRLSVGSLSHLVHQNPYIKVSVDREETMLLTPHWHKQVNA